LGLFYFLDCCEYTIQSMVKSTIIHQMKSLKSFLLEIVLFVIFWLYSVLYFCCWCVPGRYRFKIGVGKTAAAAQDSLYAIFSGHSVGDFVVSHQLDQFNAMQGLCAVC